MRTIVTFIMLAMAGGAFAQGITQTNLLPVPQSMQLQAGRFVLSTSFNIAVKTGTADTILYAAANRMYQTLNRRTGLYFSTQYITPETGNGAALTVSVNKNIAGQLNIDESYTLTVTSTNIALTAETTEGAIHGFETILQLVSNDNGTWYLPTVIVNDTPRFKWRGLMIDVARHFIPLDGLKRNIDAMAAVKLNVLHLHLSDDEGFRIESKAFPLLHLKGSNGDYYTQLEMKGLISYAQQRGITIVPEFDVPGHCSSLLAGYPQLASAPGPYKPGPRFNLPDKPLTLGEVMKIVTAMPTATIDPTKESTYSFLDKLFGEMAALFPSPYIHIGADENNGLAWATNPAIAAYMKKNNMATPHALQAYFVRRLQQLLAKHNKYTSGWEEAFSPQLPNNLLVQVWSDGSYFNKAVAHSNKVIVSKGFYLDLFMPAYIHYNNDMIPAMVPDPTQQLFYGGEGALWSEAVDMNNIDTRAWPRAAAIAERLWSPASVNNVDDMYRRLFVISRQLDELGLRHISNYERGVRRLAGYNDPTPVKVLADVLEPIKGYKKLFSKLTRPAGTKYQTAPLAEVSDIIFADSEEKRKLRAMVTAYLQNRDTSIEKSIRQQLITWKDNDKLLQPYFAGNTTLALVKEHSKNLAIAAVIGLEALDKIKEGSQPPASWAKEKTTALAACKTVSSETEIAVIREIEALVTGKLAPDPASYPMF